MARLKEWAGLLLLTFAALLIHGYHPFVEDAEIYLPGIEKRLDPALFPTNTVFFLSHANATWFPAVIAATIRWTHVPFETALFCWHLFSIFFFLLALWELSARCFTDLKARWGSVCLVTALFTMPVAGTALYIIDQYFNPRNLTAGIGIFCLVKVLDKKYVQAFLLVVIMAGLHPLMAVFAFGTAFLVIAFEWLDRRSVVMGALLFPFGLTFEPPPAAYHQVSATHPYHYLLRWQWYEWLGAIGPIAILGWFRTIARRRNMHNVDLLCRALMLLTVLSILLGVVLSSSPRFESLARIQPMRSLHLVYIIMLFLAGGLLGQFVLQNFAWRWLVLYVPLCAGMFLAQRSLFPGSAHIEWPWAEPRNAWVQSFFWIRNNTPKDAFFALNPHYMGIEGEDANGFRATAERGRLADAGKDSGAVTMFPPMADEWLRQYDAQKNWKNFHLDDFERLKTDFGVNWVLVEQPGIPGLTCPYQNAAVQVCRLP